MDADTLLNMSDKMYKDDNDKTAAWTFVSNMVASAISIHIEINMQYLAKTFLDEL